MIVLTPQLLIIVSWLCGIICRLEQRQNPIRERVFPPPEELFPGAAAGYLCWNRCWSSSGSVLCWSRTGAAWCAISAFSPTSEPFPACICSPLLRLNPAVLRGSASLLTEAVVLTMGLQRW